MQFTECYIFFMLIFIIILIRFKTKDDHQYTMFTRYILCSQKAHCNTLIFMSLSHAASHTHSLSRTASHTQPLTHSPISSHTQPYFLSHTALFPLTHSPISSHTHPYLLSHTALSPELSSLFHPIHNALSPGVQ